MKETSGNEMTVCRQMGHLLSPLAGIAGQGRDPREGWSKRREGEDTLARYRSTFPDQTFKVCFSDRTTALDALF